MMQRVAAEAREACLGVGSVCEFGRSREELAEIHDAAAHSLLSALARHIRQAQADGDTAPDLGPEEVASFLLASITESGSPPAAARMMRSCALLAGWHYEPSGKAASFFAQFWNDKSITEISR
jgi:AcrR family transcriptional regulator